MNEFVINDNYGYQDYDYLKSVIERTLQHEKVNNSIFSIIFVDNEEIHKINKTYRNVDKITDVISFALEDNETVKDEQRFLGDIYISIPKMKEQAQDYGHSEKRELSFLIVHGLLHLLGYDHMTSQEEKEMFRIQEEILNEEGITR